MITLITLAAFAAVFGIGAGLLALGSYVVKSVKAAAARSEGIARSA